MDIPSLPVSLLSISITGLGLILLVPFIMGFFRKSKFEVKGKTILITGASEGMGRSAAIQLAAKGANVIIVSRNVPRLEGALDDVKAAALNPESQFFHYISADLATPGASASVVEKAKAFNNGVAPDSVWCIAGASTPMLFLDADLPMMRAQMGLNYWAATEMAHAILGEWLKPTSNSSSGAATSGTPRKTHHLIFTSSVLAVYPIMGYAPYSPTKAAIRSLSDTLAQEMLLYQAPCPEVKIHTVLPGTITSPGFERENKTKPAITLELESSDPEQTPEEVAAKSIAGLENGEYLITVGWLGTLMRGLAWGSSSKNNTLWDLLVTWVAAIIGVFIGMDLNGKVKAYGKKHGHPQFYDKSARKSV
ncbi:hypothetical protein B7463_g6889, partial [Scytalidium lignicola]